MSSKRTANRSKASTITKTDYWLNIRTPLGVMGVSLAKGIAQHDKYLDLLETHGLVKVNKWLETKEFDGYIVKAGSETLNMDELKAEFEAL